MDLLSVEALSQVYYPILLSTYFVLVLNKNLKRNTEITEKLVDVLSPTKEGVVCLDKRRVL